jgi:hypothetical protein
LSAGEESSESVGALAAFDAGEMGVQVDIHECALPPEKVYLHVSTSKCRAAMELGWLLRP